MMNVFDRIFYWCHDHRLSAIEVLNTLVLMWWGVVLLSVPTAQMDNSPLYVAMIRIMPLWAWVCIALGIAALKVVGIVLRHLLLLLISAALAGAWWAALGTIIIFVTGTYLTPSVYFTVTAASLFRIAELTYHEDQRRGVITDG